MTFSAPLLRKMVIAIFCLALSCIPAASQMRNIYIAPDNEPYFKQVHFINNSEGYLSSYFWYAYTADSGRTLQKRELDYIVIDGTPLPLGIAFNIDGAYGFSQQKAFIYGDLAGIPAILRTDNGGATVVLVHSGSVEPGYDTRGFIDMSFPQNANLGYALESYGVCKTVNGGTNWTAVYRDPTKTFDEFQVQDNTTLAIWGEGTGRIMRSFDAGTTWNAIQVPDPGSSIDAVFFQDLNNGWLSNGGRTFRTTNGGVTWLGTGNPLHPELYLSKIFFTRDNRGYGMADGMYRTDDNGQHWERIPYAGEQRTPFIGFDFSGTGPLWAIDWTHIDMISNPATAPVMPEGYMSVDTSGYPATRTVQLLNHSKTGYSYRWLLNGQEISTAYSTSYRDTMFAQIDTVSLIVTSGAYSDTVTEYIVFSVPVQPVLTAFSPAVATPGSAIRIVGNDLALTMSVLFGTVPAASFRIVSNTEIIAIVGNGESGAVTLKGDWMSSSLPGFTFQPVPVYPAPVINSVNPGAAFAGDTVLITGSGLPASAGQASVFFGAAKAAVLSASEPQLRCIVPPGHTFDGITVINTQSHLSVRSNQQFTVSNNANGPFSSSSFRKVYTWQSFTNGVSNSIPADLDGDGLVDMVHVVAGGSIFASRNTSIPGSIAFGPDVRVGVGKTIFPQALEIRDVDGDGRPDIVAGINNGSIGIFRNTSTGGNVNFTAFGTVQVPGPPGQHLASEDLDNDGRPDFATVGYSSSELSLYRNTGGGGLMAFGERFTLPVPSGAGGIVLADLDNDGKKDIVVPSRVDGSDVFTISWWRNTGSPGVCSFAPRADMAAGAFGGSRPLSCADTDGDGKPELITIGELVGVYPNSSTTGNISFGPASDFGSATYAGDGMQVANLNGDGKPEIIVASSFMHILRNQSTTGNQVFEPPVTLDVTNDAFHVQIIDMDADGYPDLLSSGEKFEILTNINSSFADATACIGQPLTLNAAPAQTSFQWQVSNGQAWTNLSPTDPRFSGAGSAQLVLTNQDTSLSGSIFRCSGNGIYSTEYKLRFNLTPLSQIFINTDDTVICSGAKPGFFSEITGIHLSASYQWKVNGVNVGVDSQVFMSESISEGDSVQAFLSYTEDCGGVAASNIIVMHINGVMPAITISASDSVVCTGQWVTFMADPVNPGSEPEYQWFVDGVAITGATEESFQVDNLTNEQSVTVSLTNKDCASSVTVTSQAIRVRVTGVSVPTVTIFTPTPVTCPENPVRFFASTQGLAAPASFQWLVNGGPSGTDDSVYVLPAASDLDAVTVVLSTSNSCGGMSSVTSSAIVVQVTESARVIPTVTIESTTANGCNVPRKEFRATSVNGGPSPFYRWYRNDILISGNNTGNGAAMVMDNLINGDRIHVEMTSSDPCAQGSPVRSNTFTNTIATQPDPGLSIAQTSAVQCEGSEVRFTATLSNSGRSHSIQWYLNGQAVTGQDSLFISDRVRNGDKVYAIANVTGDCGNAIDTSNTIISVFPPVAPAPVVTISGSPLLLDEGERSSLTSVVINPGITSRYQWQDSTGISGWTDIGGATSGTFDYIPRVGTAYVRLMLLSTISCNPTTLVAASNALELRVNESAPDPGSGRLYPNPSTSTFVVDSLSLADNWILLEVYSQNARPVLSRNIQGSTSVSIDIRTLVPGIYVIRLARKEGGFKYFRLVKM